VQVEPASRDAEAGRCSERLKEDLDALDVLLE